MEIKSNGIYKCPIIVIDYIKTDVIMEVTQKNLFTK